MPHMSFLSAFRSILHATEAAAQIAAPVIKTVNPVIGALMSFATTAAVNVEAQIPATGTGAQKAEAVVAQTQSVVDVINAILAAEGKPQLPATTTGEVTAIVPTVVAGLNAVSAAVKTPPAPPAA
jgi:hypothetical protein